MENYNLEIERAILSTILYDSKYFEEVSSILDENDFGYIPHKNIFAVMKQLSLEELPIEESFIYKRSSKQRNISQQELSNVLGTVPIGNIKAYAKQIKDLSIKRSLHGIALRLIKSSQENLKSSQDLLEELQSTIYTIASHDNQGDFRSASEVISSTLAHIKEMKARGNSILVGLDTGFESLNRLTTGFGEGDLIIVAARPAMGKTALVLNMAQSVLNAGKGVAFFSLEMPAEQLMLRLLSAKASIALQELRIGNLREHEWEELSRAADFLSQSQLFIDDSGVVSIQQLRIKLRNIKSKNPEISLAVVDYLQLMKGMSNKDRHLEVSEISRGLKMLARQLSIPIIALSQLNRSLESRSDRRPMLSDLRDSGAIEQDADIILFVYRDAIYKLRDEQKKEEESGKEGQPRYKSNFILPEEEEAEIIIGKQRNGPTGTVKLLFQKAYTRFSELQKPNIPIEYETNTKFDAVEAPPVV